MDGNHGSELELVSYIHNRCSSSAPQPIRVIDSALLMLPIQKCSNAIFLANHFRFLGCFVAFAVRRSGNFCGTNACRATGFSTISGADGRFSPMGYFTEITFTLHFLSGSF